MEKKKLVVIGNGMAGARTVEEILERRALQKVGVIRLGYPLTPALPPSETKFEEAPCEDVDAVTSRAPGASATNALMVRFRIGNSATSAVRILPAIVPCVVSISSACASTETVC